MRGSAALNRAFDSGVNSRTWEHSHLRCAKRYGAGLVETRTVLTCAMDTQPAATCSAATRRNAQRSHAQRLCERTFITADITSPIDFLHHVPSVSECRKFWKNNHLLVMFTTFQRLRGKSDFRSSVSRVEPRTSFTVMYTNEQLTCTHAARNGARNNLADQTHSWSVILVVYCPFLMS